jgi:DNA repair protein RecN (Recombination protein N)
MLVSLTIRDVVLIERLALSFASGLCVLTGETGAGKSILLDALGLALGARADAALVRPGKGGRNGGSGQATVAAEFALADGSPVPDILADQGLDPPAPGEALVLRRTLAADGRSRAFINDQPVSIALLRRIGDALVEVEGQFASQGLLDEANHRVALDAFAGLEPERARLAGLHRALGDADRKLAEARAALEKARQDEAFLRHAAEELAALDPQPGEETGLAETRAVLMHGEKLMEALRAAEDALSEGDGIDQRIATASRLLARLPNEAAARLAPVRDALGRAADEVADALLLLNRAIADAEPDPRRLEACEERLFALRAAARKHNVAVDGLADLRASFEGQLAGLADSTDAIGRLERERDAARDAYRATAEALSKKRAKAAKALDKAVAAELPPLKLEKARFVTTIERLDEARWAEHGIDRVRFEVATNTGLAPGPIAKLASGGELARLLLALKVVLHKSNAVPTLVFDEVDSGIGGATASAVGERLARLGRDVQVLAVTHSPQVAAFGAQHLRVAKSEKAGSTMTAVDELTEAGRREEIARMLAGARVTDEARAAADSLIAARAR